MKHEDIRKLIQGEMYLVADDTLPEGQMLLKTRLGNQVLRVEILGGSGDTLPADAGPLKPAAAAAE